MVTAVVATVTAAAVLTALTSVYSAAAVIAAAFIFAAAVTAVAVQLLLLLLPLRQHPVRHVALLGVTCVSFTARNATSFTHCQTAVRFADLEATCQTRFQSLLTMR